MAERMMVVAALLAAVAQGEAQPGRAPDILRVERATWQLYKDTDASGYRRLLAPDYVNVGGDGIFGLAKELQDMQTFGVENFVLSDMQVRFPARTIAVVSYVVSVTRAGDPRHEAVPFYDASVWVLSAGAWKNVLHTHAKREQVRSVVGARETYEPGLPRHNRKGRRTTAPDSL